MENLNLIYTGEIEDPLYTAYFDGTKWSGNTTIKSQNGAIDAEAGSPPGATILNNWLYIVYPPDDKDLYCAWYDGMKWNGGVRISTMNGNINPQCRSSPNIAVYKGILFMVYRPLDTIDLHVAWFDGTTWYGNVKISDQPGGISPKSESNPAIAVYSGKLYIVYRGNSTDDFYVAWFDGLTWAGNKNISELPGGINPKSQFTPGIAVFNGILMLSYIGTWFKDIYTCGFDGINWSGNKKIKDQAGGISPSSTDSPGMGVFNNKLYLVYTGSFFNYELHVCWFDGMKWSGDTAINEQPGGINPRSSKAPQVTLTASVPGMQATWLSRMPDNIFIGDINLPGTHDSAAISTSGHTLYACQNYSITDQLQYGIRLLDVRLEVVETSPNVFFFYTCHSDYPDNTYQTFSSLMDECKEFLQANPLEVIIMSLKFDDPYDVSKIPAAALTALKNLLITYPIMESSGMPMLGDVRGSIFLYNRINGDHSFGVPIDVPYNCDGAFIGVGNNGSYRVYLQDRFSDLPTIGSQKFKFDLVVAAFNKKATGVLVWNFATAVHAIVLGVYIMGDLLDYFGQWPAVQRPSKFGWILLDYAFDKYNTNTYGPLDIVSIIIASNFSYSGYTAQFKVIQ